MSSEMDVVERVLQILQHGSYNSTYKLAVLVGLMDLCVELTSANGEPPTFITTRELAEKVVELYWRQVREWDELPLRQNRGKRGVILQEVIKLRAQASSRVSVGAGIARARNALKKEVELVYDEVEWKLIQMPLPKLQRVGGADTDWLYSIDWSDCPPPPRKSVRAYQRGDISDFNGEIKLRPEVSMAFLRLHGLLRPYVEQKWAQEVAKINELPQDRLRGFLFGHDRASLERVRGPLYELQRGSCFYCQAPLRIKASEVDHFIPWARHSDDSLDNLVLAHGGCNNDKRDHLAAAGHLERWRQRREAEALGQIADSADWDLGGDRTLGTARAIYLRLPNDARLWSSVGAFEVAQSKRLERALA